MARIQRQALKHDEFVDWVDSAFLWVEEHGRTLLMGALALVLGGGSLGGYYWYSRHQEEQAGAALTSALFTFQASVQEGLPPLPGAGPQRAFSSEEEKYRAAKKDFATVIADYPRTRSALLAKHYQALCQFELGETDAAVAGLEELSHSSDRNVAARAKLSLAAFYRKLERTQEAAELYRELVENPTSTVPREVALLELATLEAEADPEEARQLYNEIKNEFPDTAIAAEVTRRLELLPPPPTAQP